MTSRDFVIWLKGFSEACGELSPTSKQWERILEELNEVEDYNDYGDIDEEVENRDLDRQEFKTLLTGSLSSISFSITSGSTSHTYYTPKVWNDKLGSWHYTNYPEGFGYYHNDENKKQQLND